MSTPTKVTQPGKKLSNWPISMFERLNCTDDDKITASAVYSLIRWMMFRKIDGFQSLTVHKILTSVRNAPLKALNCKQHKLDNRKYK